jgi:tetratricopeptide (TPR) repeat protein
MRANQKRDIADLQSILDNAVGPVERLAALNALGDALAMLDARKAHALAEEAAALSLQLGDLTGQTWSAYILATSDYALGKFDIALNQARDALILSKQIDDIELRFRIMSIIGGIEGAIGLNDSAHKTALAALDIAERSGDLKSQATALLNLGLLYREGGELQNALDKLLCSLAITDQLPGQPLISHTYREIGAVYIGMGKYEEAVGWLEKGLEIERQSKNFLYISDLCQNLGIVHARLGHFELAEKHYQEALELRQQQGDKHGASSSLFSRGVMKFRQGDFTGAMKLYQQALTIAEEVGSKKNQQRFNDAMAESAERLGDYELAFKHLKVSYELNEELQQGLMQEREQRLRAQAEAEKSRQDAEIERIRRVELVKAQRLAKIGSYVWDLVDDRITGSEEFYSLLGQGGRVRTLSLEDFSNCFMERDRAGIIKAFLEHSRNEGNIDLTVKSLRTDDARLRTFHLIGEKPSHSEEAGTRIIGTLQDLTQQMEAEEARRDAERLHGVLEMAGTFSHEINQPLQVISTSAELLQATLGDHKEIVVGTQKILDAVQRASEITNRIGKVTTYKTKPYVGETKIIDVGEGK